MQGVQRKGPGASASHRPRARPRQRLGTRGPARGRSGRGRGAKSGAPASVPLPVLCPERVAAGVEGLVGRPSPRRPGVSGWPSASARGAAPLGGQGPPAGCCGGGGPVAAQRPMYNSPQGGSARAPRGASHVPGRAALQRPLELVPRQVLPDGGLGAGRVPQLPPDHLWARVRAGERTWALGSAESPASQGPGIGVHGGAGGLGAGGLGAGAQGSGGSGTRARPGSCPGARRGQAVGVQRPSPGRPRTQR